MAHNLTTDMGNVALNGNTYSSKDFLRSVLNSVAVVEMGNSAGTQILESTLDSALNSVASQTVDHDFSVGKIDFDQVEIALYQGMANGLTRESVQDLMDATLIKAIPKNMHRADEKA